MDEKSQTDDTPRHLQGWAMWARASWKWVVLGVLIGMGVAGCLVFWMLCGLFSTDIYIHDTYITIPKPP